MCDICEMEMKPRLARPVVLTCLLAALPANAAEPGRAELPKGRTFWGIGGSAGFSTGDHASGFGSAQVRLERWVSQPRGPGFLRGQLGFSVELVPLLLLDEGETVYAGGFNLLGRHCFEGRGAVRPFVTLGAGLLVSSDAIPSGISRVNFTPQIGLGLLFVKKESLWSVEVRLHHLSNGGRVMPNPGINSAVVQFGVSFPGSRAASSPL
jgi:hypothetical protein